MFTPLVVFTCKLLYYTVIGNPIGFGIGGFQVVYTHIGIEHSTAYIYALVGNLTCFSPCSAGPVCKPSSYIIGLFV